MVFALCLFCLAAWGLSGCSKENRDRASESVSSEGTARESGDKDEPLGSSGGAGTAPSAAGAVATDIVLSSVEGEAAVSDKNGNQVARVDGMHLYNGHEVSTQAYSYAYLALDNVKAAKLDQLSSMEVCQAGKDLQLLLGAGEVFFNVEEPLGEDESMNIRTSTMVTGIRGTAGYVKVVDPTCSEIYILEGTVAVTGYEPESGETKTDYATAGQVAVCELYTGEAGEPEDGQVQITIRSFENEDVPVYVAEEIAADRDLQERITEANPGSGNGDGNPGNDSSLGRSLSVEEILSSLEERRRQEAQDIDKRLELADARKQDWDGSDTGMADEMFFWNDGDTDFELADNGDAEDSGNTNTQSYGSNANSMILKPVGSLQQPADGQLEGLGTDDAADNKGSGNNTNVSNMIITTSYKDHTIYEPTTLEGGKYQSLTVDARVGEGNVVLNGVTIYGNLEIKGGGKNSVHVNNCRVEGTVILNKDGGEPVRLVVEGGTKVSYVDVKQEATVVVESGSAVEAVHAGAPVEITAQGGTEPSVTMAATTEECPEVTVNGQSILPDENTLPSDDPNRHQHQWNTVTTSPTCTAKGYTTYTCKDCHYTCLDDFVARTEHHYQETETIESTCLSEGFIVSVCEDCGYQEREKIGEIDPGAHRMVSDDEKKVTVCELCKKDADELLKELLEKNGNVFTRELKVTGGSEGNIYLNKEITINEGQSLTVESDPEGKYNVNLVCAGSLLNEGEITVKKGTVFSNEGDLVNNGKMNIGWLGNFINDGRMEVKAAVTVEYDSGLFPIYHWDRCHLRVDQGFIRNNGTLVASGEGKRNEYTLYIYNGGEFENYGTFTGGGVYVSGTFANKDKGRFEDGLVSTDITYGEFQLCGNSYFSGKPVNGNIVMDLGKTGTFEPDVDPENRGGEKIYLKVMNRENLQIVSDFMERFWAEDEKERGDHIGFTEASNSAEVWKKLKVKVEGDIVLESGTDLTLYNTLTVPEDKSLTVEEGASLTLGEYPAGNDNYTTSGSVEIRGKMVNSGECRMIPGKIQLTDRGAFENKGKGCVKLLCYSEDELKNGIACYPGGLAAKIPYEELIVGNSFEIDEREQPCFSAAGGCRIRIAEGMLLGVNGPAVVAEGAVIENYGTLIFRDELDNHGEIINYYKLYCCNKTPGIRDDGGETCYAIKDAAELEALLENGGSKTPINVIIADKVSLESEGVLTLNGRLEILKGASLALNPAQTFTITGGSTLEINGELTGGGRETKGAGIKNGGTINFNGDIEAARSMLTLGDIDNTGTINFNAYVGLSGEITNEGTINFNDSFELEGNVINKEGAFLNLDPNDEEAGVIYGRCDNYGTMRLIDNPFYICDRFINEGSLTVCSGSELDMDGVLDNRGTIEVEGSFDPEKPLFNEMNLFQQECGLIYSFNEIYNSGEVVNNGLIIFPGDSLTGTVKGDGSFIKVISNNIAEDCDPSEAVPLLKSYCDGLPEEIDGIYLDFYSGVVTIDEDLEVDYLLVVNCGVQINGNLHVGVNGRLWNMPYEKTQWWEDGGRMSCNSLENEGKIWNQGKFTVLGGVLNKHTMENSGEFYCGSLVHEEGSTFSGNPESLLPAAAAVGYSPEEPLTAGEPEAEDSPAAEEAEGEEPLKTEEPKPEGEEPPETETEGKDPPKTEEPKTEDKEH